MKDPCTGNDIPANIDEATQLLEDVKGILKGEVAEHGGALPIYVIQALWRRSNVKVCEDPFWALLTHLVEASEWWPAVCLPLPAVVQMDETSSSDDVCSVRQVRC